MLAEGKICPSKSLYSAPLFIVNKDAAIEKQYHEQELYPIIDWRALNDITIPNQYPLPLI